MALRVENSLALYAALAGLSALIFLADYYTPLGIAVWILYVVPLTLLLLGREPVAPIVAAAVFTMLMVATMITDERAIATWVGAINRGFGVVVIWLLALLAHSLLLNRGRLETEAWIRMTQMSLIGELQGDPPTPEIGARVLRVLGTALDVPVSALYVADGERFRLTASRGLPEAAQPAATFRAGEGLVGDAARGRTLTVVADVPADYMRITSGLGQARPTHLVFAPLACDGVTQGVVELATFAAPAARTLELLDRTRGDIGVALRSASYRERLQRLLEHTQRQADELQAQQEELRVANEELEEQSRALSSSKARLEQQQAELEAINGQLELQAQELEQQKETAQAATREAQQASRYKSEFLANMSHELRTPLNSALILARLLAENRDGHLTADEVRYAETIYASGNNLLTLINDILDLARIEAGAVDVHVEPVAPAAILRGLVATFDPIATEKGVAFTTDVATDVPDVLHTDGQRLRQILTNLLSNGFKFTASGSVSIGVRALAPGSVAFEVRDTGEGIAADKHDLIFQAFQQADGSTHRRHGGTGLGLSISRELAHLLGGEITLTSAPGIGSTFTLVVPVQIPVRRNPGRPPAGSPSRPGPGRRTHQAPPAAPAPEPVADDRDRRRPSGRLILVVEDDAAFARILYDLAHELEFDCVLAGTSDEGLRLARELAPSGILLDLALPDGSGLTLLDRLKRSPETRHIPVHVISATDHTQTALELGAIGYATKPVAREDLVRAVRTLEQRLDQRLRRVLVVEDDPDLRASLKELLQHQDVAIDTVGTAADALDRLRSQSFDCVVLDLNLPDASGYEVLEQMDGSEQVAFPPVIVYTGRDLTAADEDRLRRVSRSVILKGARSPERLLDEVTLFLHQVESRLPPGSQKLLRAARQRDELLAGKTILVVEDDVRNIFALSSVFEPRGARVVIARNGREALARVRESRPDLVLMDIMMPEMDGLAATRELRAMQGMAELPIIALTAKAMRDDYEECLAAGANDYMAKPIDVDKLVSLCRVWISR